MKLKKWSWIGLLMLCVTLLVGCVDHTSRGYLEELSGKELSRVYPTENIEDLFEQFPNGFTVSQSRVVGDSTVFVYLKAKEKGKPFVGTMKQINSKTKEEEISQTFQYVDGKFVFENEEEAKKMAEKMAKNSFTLDDFLAQMNQIRKLGPLQNILGMLPGMGKLKDQLAGFDLDNKEVRQIEAIIKSMTMAERTNPNILNGSRRKRIAAGSGTTVQRVNQLIKQFEDARKFMKQMQSMSKGKKGMFPKLPFMG